MMGQGFGPGGKLSLRRRDRRRRARAPSHAAAYETQEVASIVGCGDAEVFDVICFKLGGFIIERKNVIQICHHYLN